ncbi:hypothetical protein EOL96_06725 [Candidatus Saccharibacteria bacterium]|nr:hypothetical protein [Candidatus Saccharibacteria bacterium]
MYDYDKEMAKLQKKLDAQDKQLEAIWKAETKHKGDNEALIAFWEKLWAKGGLKFNGVKWTFRLVDLYYKEKRYDDAWRMLNEFTLSKPNYLHNTRKWQIRVLKKEKKDYAHIQHLLDKNT